MQDRYTRMRVLSELIRAVPDPSKRNMMRRAIAAGVIVSATCLGFEGLGNAEANGETRALTIQHMHTHETATITYKSGGQFTRDGLDKLNWILRDWRRDEPIAMDPRLFDVVWEATRATGNSGPIHVVSGYRSPTTNAMLRQRSNLVAKNSQHMMGKAMDFYLGDVTMDKVRDVGMRMQRGGVGYYPTSYMPFVHLDVGSVRHWPRMSHDQLARLFPDGKTVHVGTDGKQFPRYAEAYAEVIAAGGSVGGYSGDGEETAIADSSSGSGKGFFAWLFGVSDEDTAASKNRRNTTTARRGTASDTPSRPSDSNDTSPIAALQQYEAAQAAATNVPSRYRGQSIASNSPEDRSESVSAPRPAPVEKVAPIPAVAQAELRPVTQPLDRSPNALAVSTGPQLVWQNGPTPLPPQARGNATPIVVATTFSSLAGYKRVDVPLPPQGRNGVSVNVAVANNAQTVVKPDPVVTGTIRGPNGLPAVITGIKSSYDGPALAYIDNGAGRAASAPMPQQRPPEFGKAPQTPAGKQVATKQPEPKAKQAQQPEQKTAAKTAQHSPGSVGGPKDDPQTTASLSSGFKPAATQTAPAGFSIR